MKKVLVLLGAAFALYAKPIVSTSILPTAYFINQIAKDSVDVITMVAKGDDPHTYEPRPRQIKALAKSELYFSVGIEFEKVWLPKFKDSFKNLNIIDTSKDIAKIEFKDEHEDKHHEHAAHNHKAHEHEHENHEHSEHNHKTHDHDHDHHGHDHDGLDPHIWLDPVLVATQAENIAAALSKKYPQNAELYSKNLTKFKDELKELDKYIKNELSGLDGAKFIVYHPSWGYFAKRYNLEQIAIEVDGKEPSAKELAKLISEAKEENAKVIFVAPAFSKKAAELVARQTGANVVEIDPLASDWANSLKQTAKALKQALSK